MNPITFVIGLLGHMVPNPSGGGITVTPGQIQALVKAAEVFGPMLMSLTPEHVAVAEELLTQFGFGHLIDV